MDGCAYQSAQLEFGAGVAQAHLGAQHKHGQAPEGSRQQVVVADEQNLGRAALDRHKTCQHPSLGGAKGCQPCLGQAHLREILRQLVMQKVGSIVAQCANDTQMGQRREAIQSGVHALNYHGRACSWRE